MISFDWAIKRLLRNKANFGVLEGFLSELLRQKITITNILESESNQQHEKDKYNRVDILVESHDKELIIIELQFYGEDDYFQRMLYGVSKAITERLSKGIPYSEVRKVYSINIVHFDLGTGDDYIYHGFTNFRGLHTKEELELSEKQKAIYKNNYPGDLCPEYYILKVTNFNDVAKDTLDEWIYYIKNNKIKDEFTAQGLDLAREVLAYDNLTDREKEEYDNEAKIARIRDSEITTSFTDGEIKGRAKGRAEGEAIGLEKGEAIGLEKGKAEGEAKLKAEKEQTVINAHKKGMSIQDIADITTLTIEQVAEILKK
jgi:predicted transposase/invertase (TIGR01784 family)